MVIKLLTLEAGKQTDVLNTMNFVKQKSI